ncbi:hypothetical protein LTR02_014617 [Friedmanniomyces endolithicus]|uniref:Major facilitator superfamily (MFS) profile domain-containing protein n=1 Tax=Rachicladosporium monterosium TaxID=1507873 RepID=A0ABR0LD92_9PEZI|nr:hypothetical protein LTR94_018095 [Friedmanniomyces endolithicus]KAK5146540.1 hypothetical protein LTR32_001901 [Rachicladosporium monterosium]KAK0773573.1 hypothetical protein LTR59_015242 [Friedmanniomyces endolithicus]KAK0777671.1 hypothetical protein LTR38_015064 [Friedmanniomyces endolithicus]KAK0795204.1 hypothetical protein LTR75_010587 [Friedmanniomyces endolithicus]
MTERAEDPERQDFESIGQAASVPDRPASETLDAGLTHASDPTRDAALREKPEESPTEERNSQPNIVAAEEYSSFTIAQKRAIIVTGSFAAWFSPMSGSIYYPALNQIAADLHVTSAKVSITVTTYLIMQGLAPMMIAGFSDKAGRRPAYLICFTIYIIANLALALQDSYIALLLLRMLQSAGSSGTVALAQGLVGDCITSSERGQYVAWASAGTILGPTLSPILGGLLSQYCGWHWVRTSRQHPSPSMTVKRLAFFIPIALFLPETCRKIVGDGSFPPPWTSANFTDSIRYRKRARNGITIDEAKAAELRKNHKLSIPNPIGTLVVLADFESAILLITNGIGIACFYAISTGASQAFHNLYGFDDLYVSLMFLPIGAGSLISIFTTGKLVDWNYRRHAKRLAFPLTKNRQTDLSTFPIELARIQIALPLFITSAASIIGYGWMLTQPVPLAGPIILLLIFGYCQIGASQVLNILIIDIHPSAPATATAANNVLRCLIGAAATAAIIPMSDAVGNGWAYTILALFFIGSCAGPIASMRYGVEWRRVKKEKAERRRKAKEAKGLA